MKRVLFVSVILTMAVLSFGAEPGSDWNFYGSARLGGAYWNRGHWYAYERDSLGQINPDSIIVNDTLPIKRFMLDMQFNSRFGANIKKNKLGFRFEAGWGYVLRDQKINFDQKLTTQRVKEALILRRLYGEWYINEYFTLLIGHEWNIANFLSSAQVFNMEEGLAYCGALVTGRKPQIRFTYQHNLAPIDWKVEIEAARTDTFISAALTDGNEEAEEIMPKFEGGASFGFESDIFAVRLNLVGGFTRYRQLNNRIQPDEKISVIKTECEAVKLDLRVWKISIVSAYARGVNLAAYGAYMGDPEGFRIYMDTRIFYPWWGFKDSVDQVNQVRSMCSPLIRQGFCLFNIKPFPVFAFECGAGIIRIIPSAYDLKEQEKAAPNAFWRKAAYANFQFYLADEHVIIIPEVSFSDFGGGLGGQTIQGSGGKWTAIGCKLQIDI